MSTNIIGTCSVGGAMLGVNDWYCRGYQKYEMDMRAFLIDDREGGEMM